MAARSSPPSLDPVARLAMALAEILPPGVEVEVRLRRSGPHPVEGPPAAAAVRRPVGLALPQPPEEDIARGARPKVLCDAYAFAAERCSMRDWTVAERLMRNAVLDVCDRQPDRAVSVLGLGPDMRCPLGHVLYRLLELVGDDLLQGADR